MITIREDPRAESPAVNANYVSAIVNLRNYGHSNTVGKANYQVSGGDAIHFLWRQENQSQTSKISTFFEVELTELSMGLSGDFS